MEKELIKFIDENNLSPFNSEKTRLSRENDSLFKTRDGKAVYNRVLAIISENFIFKETSNLWNFFSWQENLEEIKKLPKSNFSLQGKTQVFPGPFKIKDFEGSKSGTASWGVLNPDLEIKKRQEFFKKIQKQENEVLKCLSIPKKSWKPRYNILAVTEDEKTFIELQKIDCPVQFINSENDLDSLKEYDIIQVVDCEQFSRALEQFPQSVFVDSEKEVYLERYLETLSGWRQNLELLSKAETNEKISLIVSELLNLLELIKNNPEEKFTREKAEASLEKINENIEKEISKLSISGTSLVSMLSQGKIPQEFKGIISKSIKDSGIPENILTDSLPVKNTNIAEKIKRKSNELQKIPEKLKELSNLLVLFDFTSGISKFTENKAFPEYSEELNISESKNLFLDNAQPISFHLNPQNRCSILTGANSGGKTTLLEHIIQLLTLFQLGLPIEGKLKTPVFTEIYYFAKNKGSTNKGAFETLLSQMNKINPGEKTLILADEIESVTEPGIAGKIICATAEYFIERGCFLVIATHLGQEIQKSLPNYARVDGIEAKGLDEYYELIVDHNPILGRLASSTPELIVEKMANSEKTDYFNFLNNKIKLK
ncbi:hypothetical protein HYW76_04600 [Candidatus Pacearchaeota archaeon]|nr:hypothetical protein [Candidatus Pacearchaeota archaeon]